MHRLNLGLRICQVVEVTDIGITARGCVLRLVVQEVIHLAASTGYMILCHQCFDPFKMNAVTHGTMGGDYCKIYGAYWISSLTANAWQLRWPRADPICLETSVNGHKPPNSEAVKSLSSNTLP